MLEFALLEGREQGRRGGLRRVETGPERGVREPAVGLLAALRRRFLGAHRLRGVGEQGDPALQQGSVCGDAAGLPAGGHQLGFQGGLFAVEPFPPGVPGSGAPLGRLAPFEPLGLLPFGSCESLACGVRAGRGAVRLGVLGRQPGDQGVEFGDGGVSVR